MKCPNCDFDNSDLVETNKKEGIMIEVNMIYDLPPGTDQQAYLEWAKKAVGLVMQSPGLIEFRASRNLLGSPYIRSTTVWNTLSDWVNFAESEQWGAIQAELLGSFTADIKIEIWGPSPVVPEPLRPGS